MKGQRAAIGLSLLCVLLFSAFAAPSAHAVKGTTLFTCTNKGQGTKTFADAHCAKAAPPNFYEHEAAGIGQTIMVSGWNKETLNETKESTPDVLKATIGGVKVEGKCATVESALSMTNEVIGGQMRATGQSVSKYSGCTTNIEGCTVAEPITSEANVETRVEGEEMWVEFVGKGASETFAELKFKGKCPFGEITLPLKGKTIATPKGAVWEFPASEPKSKLELGKSAATDTGAQTNKLNGGEALAITTQAT